MMEREHYGQRFALLGTVPHRRVDGTWTSLARWQGWCARCGERFEFTTPVAATKFQPNRRCAKHKRPGQRVPHPQVEGRSA
jgi:hypothetical protein